jgi:hypothetical protein
MSKAVARSLSISNVWRRGEREEVPRRLAREEIMQAQVVTEAKMGGGICACGDTDCVIEDKVDDTAVWLGQVRKAEEGVRAWLKGLEGVMST